MARAPSLQLLSVLRGSNRPFRCAECTQRQLRPRARMLQIDASAATTESPSLPSKSVQPLRKQLKEEAKSRGQNDKQISSGSKHKTNARDLDKWELTVGIEIHAELNTTRKLFSAALTSINDSPNTHVSVFDAALPGAQPQFQRATLLPALRAALALECSIARKSSWDRKHYFWWDQPNGYQITQYYEPFAKDGRLVLYEHDDIDPADFPSTTIGIKQIQMEQDTAKTVLQPPHTHLLDLNRVSHPLIEIITLPQIHSPKTAAAVVRKIQSILKAVGANLTGMEMGGLRADVNVSVRRRRENEDSAAAANDHDNQDCSSFSYAGVTGLGQRTEIKNLSSIKAIEDAIVAERNRQIDVLEAGGIIEGETRGFTLGGTETRRLRSKEGEVDYRYMPDPDLGPVIIGEDLLQHLRETLPALPDESLRRLTEIPLYALSSLDARALIALDDGDRLDYYLDVVHLLQSEHALSEADGIGRMAGNWVIHELGALLSTHSLAFSESLVPSAALASIIAHVHKREITLSSGKTLLAYILTNISSSSSTNSPSPSSTSSPSVVSESGSESVSVPKLIDALHLRLQRLSDEAYAALAAQVVADNPDMAAKLHKQAEAEAVGEAGTEAAAEANAKPKRRNNEKLKGKIMWFVGQMVRKGEKGSVQPERAESAIRSALGL